MPLSEQELYEYHEETFKPIYADLVAVIGTKPEQIVFELEAALSHIAVAKTNTDLYEENIQKAYGHLQRASLDAAKIMWLEYMQKAEKITLDPDLRKFATNASEKELLTKYQNAEELARRARKKEVQNTGKSPSEAIELYYEAALSFSEIIKLIDPEKLASLTVLKSKILKKEVLLSFIIGIISSAIVAYIFS